MEMSDSGKALLGLAMLGSMADNALRVTIHNENNKPKIVIIYKMVRTERNIPNNYIFPEGVTKIYSKQMLEKFETVETRLEADENDNHYITIYIDNKKCFETQLIKKEK